MEEKETENIVKIINGKFPAMSRGQRKLAEYILAQYDKAAFLTAAQIGKQVGVSESHRKREHIRTGGVRADIKERHPEYQQHTGNGGSQNI